MEGLDSQTCDIHCPELLLLGDVPPYWVRPRAVAARALGAFSIDECHLDKVGNKRWPLQRERRKPCGQTLLCSLKVWRGFAACIQTDAISLAPTAVGNITGYFLLLKTEGTGPGTLPTAQARCSCWCRLLRLGSEPRGAGL